MKKEVVKNKIPEMNIKQLLDDTEKVSVKLILEPLAPLSMVTVLPGSYYRSVRKPTKHMLCGLLENILGMQYHLKLRKDLIKSMEKQFKKQKRPINKSEFESSSGYTSILYPLIEVEFGITPVSKAYDDLWTQHLKAKDERHTRGVRNMDYRFFNKIAKIENSYKTKLRQAAEEDEKKELIKQRDNEIKLLKREEATQPNIPNFYQSPKRREFIIPEENFQFKIKISESLFKAVQGAVDENNTGYLGTSEGWVNVKIQKL